MTIQWITIQVSDNENSLSFYRDYLGLKVESSFSPNEGMEITFLKADNGMAVELIRHKGRELPPADSSAVSIGMRTEAYEELLARARDMGILKGEPVKLGGMDCFFVQDPNGVGIQLIKN